MKVAVIYNTKVPLISDVINFFGPQTKEHYNPKAVERVAAALEKGGHNVRIIEGNIHLADTLRDFMPKVISGDTFGMVFNMAYGIQGQSRYTHIPALLEMLGVPYVGSGPQAHAVALDKIMTKMVLKQHGLPTPDFWFFNNADADMSNVVFPVIVKPKMEAVSYGLKVVHDIPSLREAVKEVIDNFEQDALAESFIPGREFAVGVLGNGPDMEILPVVEIDLGGDPNAIQPVDQKQHKPGEKLCPAPIPDELTESLKNLARDTFNALGICDFCRIDVRMDADDRLFILELNSMASLGGTGSFVHAAKTAGYTDQGLINRMLDVAAVRYFGQNALETPEDAVEDIKPLRTRIRTFLRTQMDTLRDFLALAGEQSSFAENPDDVNQLGAWMAARLSHLGFQKQVIPGGETGNLLYLTNHGEDRNHVLLLGYLDTSRAPFELPFREERGRFYGTGIAENKGGLVVLLGALLALRYTRRIKKTRIGILLIPDETLNGRFSRKTIREMAEKSGAVLGLKGARAGGGIVTSAFGQLRFTVELHNPKGRPAGDVLTPLCQKVVSLQKLGKQEDGTFVMPIELNSPGDGSHPPAQARATFILGFRDSRQQEDLEAGFVRQAKKISGLNVRLRKGGARRPRPSSEASREFFEMIARAARQLEIKVEPIEDALPTSLNEVPPGIPALESMGPTGEGAQTPTEYIFRDSLLDRAALLAIVIYRLGNEGKQ
jgi:D-alanine-D-alanine ligase